MISQAVVFWSRQNACLAHLLLLVVCRLGRQYSRDKMAME